MRFDALARLLQYPGPESSGQADSLPHFARRIAGMSQQELEELYTRTFDLNPLSSLEVGWHLFGENYERGRFLVTMRGQLRRFGLAESTELPDHLTHVLQVLDRMEPEEAGQFTTEFLLPALDKMLEGLRGKDNPYELLLQAVRLECAEGRIA